MKVHKLPACLAIAGAMLAIPAAFTSCDDNNKDEPIYIPVFDPYNACYKGVMESSFSMGMQDMTFSTADTQWNVIIDIRTNRATLKIINACFAQGMPSLPVLKLEGLTYDSRMLTVTGTDIVPEVSEGSGFTPNENYTFKSVKITFKDGHSDINATFEVNLKMPNGMETVGTGKFTSNGIIL